MHAIFKSRQVQAITESNDVWRVFYQLLGHSLHIDFDYELLHLPYHNIKLMVDVASVTGHQEILTLSGHLVSLFLFFFIIIYRTYETE